MRAISSGGSLVELGAGVQGIENGTIKEFAKHQTFARLFCNSCKFYGRFSSVLFSHNAQLGRVTKAISLAT